MLMLYERGRDNVKPYWSQWPRLREEIQMRARCCSHQSLWKVWCSDGWYPPENNWHRGDPIVLSWGSGRTRKYHSQIIQGQGKEALDRSLSARLRRGVVQWSSVAHRCVHLDLVCLSVWWCVTCGLEQQFLTSLKDVVDHSKGEVEKRPQASSI